MTEKETGSQWRHRGELQEMKTLQEMMTGVRENRWTVPVYNLEEVCIS